MKLLLVEDYRPLRTSLTRGLEEAGFAVDVTGDGEEALWYARDGSHDVILLDLMLPGVDGLTILETLRAEGIDAQVLVLTARDAVEDRIRGLDLGADDYLVKPFAFGELLARIRALVRRRFEEKRPVFRVGDLEVDTTRKVARRAGRELGLTAREFAILEYLAYRAGDVVERDEIRQHIYAFDDEPESNVIGVYIGNLRRKLEAEGGSRVIRTRRGLGYVLEPKEDR